MHTLQYPNIPFSLYQVSHSTDIPFSIFQNDNYFIVHNVIFHLKNIYLFILSFLILFKG